LRENAENDPYGVKKAHGQSFDEKRKGYIGSDWGENRSSNVDYEAEKKNRAALLSIEPEPREQGDCGGEAYTTAR